MSTVIDAFEKSQQKETIPDIQVGDIVRVSKIIIEGKKKRTQRFEGTVIKRSGKYSRANFTVRKVIGGVGVEKTFLLHSPLVPEVAILQRSKVRRARLYYLRQRIGSKATRLKVKDS